MIDTTKTNEKATKKQNKSGAELLIDSLKKQQVEMIFGYPGGAVLLSTMLFTTVIFRIF